MEFLPFQSQMYHPSFAQQNGHPYAHDSYTYVDPQQRAQMYMPRRSVSLDGLRQAMVQQGEKNETKARLAKDQVEILEAKFQENNKPNSQVKRLLAADFGVEQARINNWFQNRRAKAKQEKKQLEHDAQNGSNREVSYDDEAGSPEAYDNDMFDDDCHGLPLGNMVQMPILSGPPTAPVASYHPQYNNASTASMHSLHRTLTAAEEALAQNNWSEEFNHDPSQFSNSFHGESRAPFPANNEAFPNPMMPTDSTIAMNAQQVMAAQANGGYFINLHQADGGVEHGPHQPFPSQLLEGRLPNGYTPAQFQSHAMMAVHSAPAAIMSSPESTEASFSLNSIPGPSNIASRRAKQRPANLGLDALRNNGLMGPRSYSSSDIPNRLNQPSPTGSPMRRVHSNQVGLNVLSGRVQKIGMPLRSPMSRSFNLNCENYLRDIPQSATTAFNSEFPPTPSSPYDKQVMPQAQSSTSSSPLDSDSGFIFQGSNFEGTEQGSNMASPPETPHNPIVNNHWAFEAMDQPLQTPNFDMFPSEMHMHMPPFVSPVSASGPNTPAFGTFTGFPMQHDQQGFEMKFDQQLEYIFPGESMPYANSTSTKSSPVSVQKTFTFNNVTQESLKEQQRRTEEREKTPVSKVVRV